MSSRLQRALPVTAVAGALLAAASLTLLSLTKQAALATHPQVPGGVTSALRRVADSRPVTREEPAFRRELDRLRHTPRVASVWVFSPEGRLESATGVAAHMPRGMAQELATAQTRRLLSTLPPGALRNDQRIWLLAASAIQREGEHNDIYGHLLYPVRGDSAAVVALVGAAYEVGPIMSGSGLAWKLAVLSALAGLVIYWVSLPLWVLLTARERGEPAGSWATFVFVGNLVALLAYLLTRSNATPKPPM